MRGQHSVESAIKSSAGWCLSFLNTATVPAILWLEDNYNCDCEKEDVAYGAISTEHSVMCSNFAIDGDEETQIRRLLTKIYPYNNFSMVSDSYDYWNLVTNTLPKLKKEIMEHDGCISIRGDSGDPVEIIAGIPLLVMDEQDSNDFCMIDDKDEANEFIYDLVRDYLWDINCESDITIIIKSGDEYIRAKCIPDWSTERGALTDSKYYYIDNWSIDITRNAILTPEEKGTVWTLWDMFGGTINSKGYRVLNPHIKAIYGDSITPQRCKEIYRRLTDKGFAINNVTLGVGSFSMMCLETIEENKKAHYNPYTRDTFGIAVKATYAEDENDNPIMIYKQPKALSWKKSQKGCCVVDPNGQDYTDCYTWKEICNFTNPYSCGNLLHEVFLNGIIVNNYTLAEVRNNMYPEGF